MKIYSFMSPDSVLISQMADKVPFKTLSNGQKVPVVGLGTWKGQPDVLIQAVKDAIDIGYRHIDCALVYQNEKAVGEAIAAKIADGTVKREDLFIVTKLWNIHHEPEKVEVGLKQSLENLGLDYVDLYLIHWPMAYEDRGELFPKDENGKFYYTDVDYVDTWKGMEALVEKGLTKAIGLSNFNSKQIQRVLDSCKIKPVMLQVECHPWLDQSKLQKFCEEKGIAITAYSPLGSPDRPWAKPGDPTLLDDPEIKLIGEKYGKNNAQICIKYQVQKGRIVIPKSVHKERLEQNLNVFDFDLSDEDLARIDLFARGKEGRLCGLTWISDHPHYPFGEDVDF